MTTTNYKKLPLLVSSPSNASNASSVASPWRDDLQPSQFPQQPQQKPERLSQSPLGGAPPASSFDTASAGTALFLGNSTLAPTPETAAVDIDGGSLNTVDENGRGGGGTKISGSSKSLPPATAFPGAHYLDVSDDDGSSDDGEE